MLIIFAKMIEKNDHIKYRWGKKKYFFVLSEKIGIANIVIKIPKL